MKSKIDSVGLIYGSVPLGNKFSFLIDFSILRLMKIVAREFKFPSWIRGLPRKVNIVTKFCDTSDLNKQLAVQDIRTSHKKLLFSELNESQKLISKEVTQQIMLSQISHRTKKMSEKEA